MSETEMWCVFCEARTENVFTTSPAPGAPNFCHHYYIQECYILITTCFQAGFLLGLLSAHEDGGVMFLRNVD
jgi:hypothetical protein